MQISNTNYKSKSVKAEVFHFSLKNIKSGCEKSQENYFMRTYTLLVLWKKEINTNSRQPEPTVQLRRHCRLIPISD